MRYSVIYFAATFLYNYFFLSVFTVFDGVRSIEIQRDAQSSKKWGPRRRVGRKEVPREGSE